jgi:hypothetical protein
MEHKIGRRVMARYQRHLDEEVTEQMWSEAVDELPKSLQNLFDRPKETEKHTHLLTAHSFEKEVQLDGNDVSLFLKVSYTVEDDSDGYSEYGVGSKNVEFWFTADPWADNGEIKVSSDYDDLDLSTYKRLMHSWVGKVKELHPEVAERFNLR